MTICVGIVGNRDLFLEGLRSVLAGADDFEIVGVANDCRVVAHLAAEKQPHVVLMDVALSDLGSVQAISLITGTWTNTRVLCLVPHADKSLIRSAFAAGASGVLLKSCAPEELSLAINWMWAIGCYLSPALSSLLLDEFARPPGSNGRVDGFGAGEAPRLTQRERDTLHLIATGWSTKRIAAKFGVSIKTACTHRENLMGKLAIDSVSGLTKYAIRIGLTSAQADR